MGFNRTFCAATCIVVFLVHFIIIIVNKVKTQNSGLALATV